MKKEDFYEVNLPVYLQNDIDALLKEQEKDSLRVDCYADEVYGSINSAYYSHEITWDQAEYLRYKYLFSKEED